MIPASKAVLLWKLNEASAMTDLVAVPHEQAQDIRYREFLCSGGACREDWDATNEANLLLHLIRILLLYPFANSAVRDTFFDELAQIPELGNLKNLIVALQDQGEI